MKTTDNIKKKSLLTVLGALSLAWVLGMTCVIPIFAIEGLQVSIQSSNVVLSWPSDPSESYIVQYRPTLDPTNGWRQLTNQYPADTTGSNITYFIHTNGVNFATGSTNGGSGGSGTNSGPGGLTPPGGGTPGTNGGFTSIPGVGFYQVVREGVYITDQAVLQMETYLEPLCS